jgi:hypothetical protein
MRKLLLAAMVMSFAAPVLADDAATAKKTAEDPNKIVCRREEVVGSRLATNKRCLTVRQWTEMQRDLRMTVDRVQAAKLTNGGG